MGFHFFIAGIFVTDGKIIKGLRDNRHIFGTVLAQNGFEHIYGGFPETCVVIIQPGEKSVFR